ncbi:MAG: TetR/AcrR family transcriptional regulator, partial [Gemmatimonas sp.]
ASGEPRATDVILDAALHLYGREGYAAVTIRALARVIGCSPGALYTHFSDTDEIIRALQARGLRLFAEAVMAVNAADPIEALRRFFLAYYEFSKAQPDYFALLWVDHIAPAIEPAQPDLRRVVAFGHGLAERCLKKGAIPAGLTPVTITTVLWCSVHGAAVLRRMASGAPGPAGDLLAASTLEIALAGLQAGILSSVPLPTRRPAVRP